MENVTKNRLGEEPIVPLLFKLGIPSILSMFIQALYNIVDSIFVARFSEDALASLSIAFPIQMALIAIAVGTGTGTSSIISRLLGQGEEDKASRVAEHALIISLIYGTVMAIIGFFFSETLIRFFTDIPILVDYGTRYIRIILIGSIFMFIPMIANNILRGEGNTFLPMLSMLMGSIINVILDPILIFGIGPFPVMGVDGAALATVIARIISGFFIVYMLFNGKNQVNLRFKNFKYTFEMVKSIYEVGLPAMTMQMLSSVMVGGLNLILGNYSTTAISALGIYYKLQSFVFMPVFGLTQGYMPILGYNYGNRNPQRMKETIKYGVIIAFTFTMTGFILFQLFPVQLVMLFNDSPELIEVGTKALKGISLAFPLVGPAIIGATTFQSLGMGFPSLILSFSRQIILLLPLAYILSKIGGINSVWYSFPIAEAIAIIGLILWLGNTLRRVFQEIEC